MGYSDSEENTKAQNATDCAEPLSGGKAAGLGEERILGNPCGGRPEPRSPRSVKCDRLILAHSSLALLSIRHSAPGDLMGHAWQSERPQGGARPSSISPTVKGARPGDWGFDCSHQMTCTPCSASPGSLLAPSSAQRAKNGVEKFQGD